jgi:hypothetical protein
MANKIKFSELPIAEKLESNDIFPIVKGRVNYSSKGEHIVDYVNLKNDFFVQINKILTGENANKTVLNLTEELSHPDKLDKTVYHRPYSVNLPSQRGWIDTISNVQLSGVNLISNIDYVFYPDRQIFYFLDKETQGDITYTGYSLFNSIVFDLSASKKISKESFTNTLIYTDSVLNVSLSSPTEQNPRVDFYFNANDDTLFLKTTFDGLGANLQFDIDGIGEVFLTFTTPFTASHLTIPKILWNTISAVYSNGTILNPNTYNKLNNSLVFNNSITNSVYLTVEGVTLKDNPSSNDDPVIIKYNIPNFTGNILNLPQNFVDVTSASILGVKNYDDQPREPVRNCFAMLHKKTRPENDLVYLGDNYPSSGNPATISIKTSSMQVTCLYSLPNFYGNLITIPDYFTDVLTLSINGDLAPVVFENDTQTLVFTKNNKGILKYTAVHHAYEGLSSGGETVEILDEIKGLFATTCGTGHYFSTVSTLSPYRNFTPLYEEYYGKDWVAIADDLYTAIYYDFTDGAKKRPKMGFTDTNIKPLTLKLPLACLWPNLRINDSSLFQLSFSPDSTTPFDSSTYFNLDDTKRQSESSLSRGKIINISNNTSIPVRGARGLNINGSNPVYYSGRTIPFIMISSYKWFVVKCKNTNGNSKLDVNQKYLMCVNNVNLDQTILCRISNNDYNVSVDLFPFYS